MRYQTLQEGSKLEQSNRNEPPTSENKSTTHPNNTEQILTHEQKLNLENLKRIMNLNILPYHH